MTLAELGALLREAREGQNLTIAHAADILKLPTRILKGVEEGSDHVPRTVYVHHFIKDYARFLGFQPAEITKWLNELEGFENVTKPNIADSGGYTSVKPSILPAILGGILKLIFLGAVGFGIYSAYVYFFAARDYDEGSSVPTVQEQPLVRDEKPALPAEASPWGENAAEKPASEESPQVWEGGTVQQSAVPAEDSVQESDRAVPETEEQTGGVSENSAASAGAAEPLPVSPAASDEVKPISVPAAPAEEVTALDGDVGSVSSVAVLLPAGMHRVEVIADLGECWMGIEPDGKKQQRTLRRGDSFSLTFRDSLVMRLGHASAVRIIYNGRELERSSSARVKTFVFPLAD